MSTAVLVVAAVLPALQQLQQECSLRIAATAASRQQVLQPADNVQQFRIFLIMLINNCLKITNNKKRKNTINLKKY